MWYVEHFLGKRIVIAFFVFTHIAHSNFVGELDNNGSFIVSVKPEDALDTPKTFRVLFRTKKVRSMFYVL